MAKRPNRTEIQAKSRDKTGLKSASVYLQPDERELWDRLAAERGESKKAVFMAGLRALERGNDISQADVLGWIKRNTRDD
jgi:hypothetical protein